jgi:hypothetical protein
MNLENFSPQLKEIAKVVNSTRPLRERFERDGWRIRRKIRPENILMTIHNNKGYLEKDGVVASGPGYLVRSQGDSYVIMAYTHNQFLSLNFENVWSGEGLPEPTKQWKLSKDEVKRYL